MGHPCTGDTFLLIHRKQDNVKLLLQMDIRELEQRVSRIESDSIEYKNNLDNVKKQMYNLLKKANRLNTLVINQQKKSAFDDNSDQDGSCDLLSKDGSVCFPNVLDRNAPGHVYNTLSVENCEEIEEDYSEDTQDNGCYSDDDNINNLSNYMNVGTVQLLTLNAMNDESNTIRNEPLGAQSDSININESNTIHNKPLGAQSDSININESNTIDNQPLGVQSDSININGSNIMKNEPLGAQSDTININELKEGSYNVKVQDSTLLNSSDEENSVNENVVSENETRQDNLLCTMSKEVWNKDLPEIDNCNISKSKGRIHKKVSGYKSKSTKSQNDNRVSFHNDQESSKANTDKSNIAFQNEELSVPNIKPSTHNRVDERTMMTSATSYSLSRRASRRERYGDIFGERLFNSDQPKTLREWYHYFRQVKAYASARVRSGVVKQAKGNDVILVIDTSERMSEYFQQLKSVALQYVYGIELLAKQHIDCCKMGNGIGLAVFGRQARLIQEATNDYELVVELIGKLRPDGDAPILAGLLMGFAGVSSCIPGSIGEAVVPPHMIIFTNGSSEQSKRLLKDEQIPNLDLSNLPAQSDINGVIDEIAATSTKIYYVPIGRHQRNNILEHAVRQTNGKVIPVHEVNRLINMTHVMKIALRIVADKRFSENQSTDVIRMKISEYMNDIHGDCLDMVKEFSNPLKIYNMRGQFVELKFNTLKLGDRVRKGPNCRCGNKDLGLAGTVIGQGRDGDVLVEWDHGLACFYDYDDEPEEQNIVKVNEVRMLVGEPMAVGCRVVRGQDWKYANTDGGRGTYGTVLCILEEGKVVNEETQKYNKTQQRLKKREIMKHHNDSSTIKSNDCDTDDYLIPIYSDVAVSAIWEYKRVSQWIKYPSGINVKIEKAYQRKKSGKIIIEMDRTTYLIHFSRMVQENVKNKTELAVRRKD
ncbi:Hypothetical predicted protein [Mytilus galloprovincialis]|uniref:MIB/HERC2 domain-containing protein n=1 Tax=Mytilus galloprovincialis TaxID=29158 RepID=A0A8B6GLL8_MYTGA|nr:Hypothetical predicted protein [Mytilus galloprovincialis]